MQCCLEPQKTTLHKVLQKACPWRYSWDNIAQIKTMRTIVQESPNNISQVEIICNVVFEAPDNNVQEKVMFNVALIIFDNIAQEKLHAMLSQRLQTALHNKKSYLMSS